MVVSIYAPWFSCPWFTECVPRVARLPNFFLLKWTDKIVEEISLTAGMHTNIPEPCPNYQLDIYFFNALLGQEKRLQSQSADGSLLAGYQMIYFLCLWSKEEKIK